VRVVLVVAALLVVAGPVAGSPDHPIPRAEALVQSAERHLGRNTIDSRRLALRELEQATLIDRDNPDYELLLARAYYRCGFLQNSKARFERVMNMTPEDADARFGLGQVWRRDWLKFLERSSLDHSIEHFSASARLDPKQSAAWVQLVPLLLERGDISAAATAAAHAAELEPGRPEVLLAGGATAYHTGNMAKADSCFNAAIPRLPKQARDRFDDIAPVASAQDTFKLHRLSPADQKKFIAGFWRENDPDLASPENEAKLEYWARVTQAYFLYFDTKRREWDERGEVYVRYGPPTRITYNPTPEHVEDLEIREHKQRDWFRRGTATQVLFGTGPAYPANAQLWEYPDLGMSVLLQDRTLTEYYLLPTAMEYDPDPAPNPDSLDHKDGALAVRDGRGVFRKLPPGVQPRPVSGHIALFQSGEGPRLLADVESPGAPGDSLWAEWVVLDSLLLPVAGGSRSLSPSACDPSGRRVAQFATGLPVGYYLVGLTVHDQAGRRGVFRSDLNVEKPSAGLALSDVVVSCGLPETAVMTHDVRIESNPAGHVGPGDPLTVYFEIYHLAPDANGQSRFQYVYTVKSAERDRRVWLQRVFAPRPKIPEISASRETENAGDLRRQFVTVPVQTLPAGHYLLEISVKDLVGGDEVKSSALFVKDTATTLRN
jgi:GWxTD domain-containing protein